MGIFSSKKNYRILLLGLDGSGKTTILNQFKNGVALTTVPTIGFNNETIKYKKILFDIWEVGGNDKLRFFWKNYVVGIKGIIYVIDSNDKERLYKARKCLELFLFVNKLENIPVLVLANKQDYKEAMVLEQINTIFNLNYFNNKKMVIQSCCAIEGIGLREGLKWLSKNIKSKSSNNRTLKPLRSDVMEPFEIMEEF